MLPWFNWLEDVSEGSEVRLSQWPQPSASNEEPIRGWGCHWVGHYGCQLWSSHEINGFHIQLRLLWIVQERPLQRAVMKRIEQYSPVPHSIKLKLANITAQLKKRYGKTTVHYCSTGHNHLSLWTMGYFREPHRVLCPFLFSFLVTN